MRRTNCTLSPFVLLMIAGSVLTPVAPAREGAARASQLKRPNIILMVSDDHGRDTAGYGNPAICTPHLDSLSDDGILVLDDFFEIRWPDVTVAVIEFLKDNKNIVPFLLVNRKLYCTTTSDSAESYQSMFASVIEDNAAEIGDVRCWRDVVMMDGAIMVAKMEMSERLQQLEKLR